VRTVKTAVWLMPSMGGGEIQPAKVLKRVMAYDSFAKNINLGTAGYGAVRPGGVRAGGGGSPGYSIIFLKMKIRLIHLFAMIVLFCSFAFGRLPEKQSIEKQVNESDVIVIGKALTSPTQKGIAYLRSLYWSEHLGRGEYDWRQYSISMTNGLDRLWAILDEMSDTDTAASIILAESLERYYSMYECDFMVSKVLKGSVNQTNIVIRQMLPYWRHPWRESFNTNKIEQSNEYILFLCEKNAHYELQYYSLSLPVTNQYNLSITTPATNLNSVSHDELLELIEDTIK